MALTIVIPLNTNGMQNKFSTSPIFGSKSSEIKKIFDQDQLMAKIKLSDDVFELTNDSSEKVGTAIILQPNDAEFKELKILVKDGTKISNSENAEGLSNKINPNNPSFKGHIYGSIGENNFPEKMRQAYNDFFKKGMFKAVLSEFGDKKNILKKDYNFFVPTDGDGSRFKDYTNLQGGTCKPAAILPAKFNEEPLKLIHATLINFAKTKKVQSGMKFINVDKARGSAFAFLEGLKSGKIPTNKPMVFSWGDSFSNINVAKLIEYHEQQGAGLSVLGMGVPEERMKSLGAIYLHPGKGFEIQGFMEKPQNIEDMAQSELPHKKGEYLASIGPFVLAPEVLKYLKKEYTNNPAQFQHTNGDFDFSRRVLTPLAKKLGKGEITNSKGKKIPMLAYLKPENERWGDLGKTTDLIEEMRAVKAGKYPELPQEIQDSISKNIDDKGIIYQNEKTKELFERFCKKYNIEITDAQIIVWSI